VVWLETWAESGFSVDSGFAQNWRDAASRVSTLKRAYIPDKPMAGTQGG